jgi:hypothetical protein
VNVYLVKNETFHSCIHLHTALQRLHASLRHII